MSSLSVRRLCFAYGTDSPVLDEISFDVADGECIGLIGPNGAGKSTLLLHLNGLLRGTGEIRVGDLRLEDRTLKDIRRRVGLVFQDPDDQLFMHTIREDVAFGPTNLGWQDARVRAIASLELVGLTGAADRPPQSLSVGQRKRAAIAWVLAMEPGLLAMDEPTSGLDPGSRRRLIGLLRDLPQTRLIATHDLPMVRELCSPVILLDGGRQVAEGPTESLLNDGALLEAHDLSQPNQSGPARSHRLFVWDV